MKTLSQMSETELRRKQVFAAMSSLYEALDHHDSNAALTYGEEVCIVLAAIVRQENIILEQNNE